MQALFKKLGLTDKQAQVYLAVLELGSATMTELSKKAHLKRPTAYLVVDELIMLGLLAQTKLRKRKIYSAIHPRRLVEIAHTRERQVEEILPELVALHNAQKEKPKIQVFEGEEGVNHVYAEVYKALNKKQEALWFTNIEALHVFPGAIDMYKEIIKTIKDPKIRELNYGNEAGKKWAKEGMSLSGKNHFIRTLPTDFEFGMTDMLIFENKVVMFSLQKDLFVIMIESEDLAKSHRAMFNWAWEMGK